MDTCDIFQRLRHLFSLYNTTGGISVKFIQWCHSYNSIFEIQVHCRNNDAPCMSLLFKSYYFGHSSTHPHNVIVGISILRTQVEYLLDGTMGISTHEAKKLFSHKRNLRTSLHIV
ncbi:hypothetical protein C922_05562 [Plasmodium inui San Antonio 1]|uniref:Uncharacterized protein n=1 Tax=Plasmodium inui San Antonio 1 TaxID=1237626 RepID=W6ZXT0_9APIC|nr:hypothetical protein C922_05562 [Plasmodium inui San Antonio 1]EUD64055.1 hypothetical protein C922_05562 [Plasmodium inui San Antonio 1]